jgi:hypothetical protein
MIRRSFLTCLILFLVPSAITQDATSFSKYNRVEAYEVRPGILMMPRYTSDGQFCEIGIEVRHYSPELIRVDPSLSNEEIEKLVEEFVPPADRRPRSTGLPEPSSIEGHALTISAEYEGVIARTFSTEVCPWKSKKNCVLLTVAATITWKNRECA